MSKAASALTLGFSTRFPDKHVWGRMEAFTWASMDGPDKYPRVLVHACVLLGVVALE